MAADILGFMDSPLVTWVRTFKDGGDPMDFQDLCDGAYLNDVLFHIDQRDLDSMEVKRVTKDNNARLHNWALLIRNIRNYYQEILQQLVVTELPDVVAVVKDPTKEVSLKEMSKVLLLLLGCAVQCDRKEYYINIITQMDINLQQSIVDSIKQITDSGDTVYSMAEVDDDMKQFTEVLKRVVQERDKYTEVIPQLTQERDYYRRELEKKGVVLSPPAHLEKYHLKKELTEQRSRLQALNEDVEEKTKLMSDMKEELDEAKMALSKLKFENLSLTKDAKAARGYRDELDVMNEKVLNVAKYEKEIRRYKEKLNEADFYKSRVEELREDNSTLLEAKTKFEEQQETQRRKKESLLEDLMRLQSQLEQSHVEKEKCQRKMEQLVEENAALEFEKTTLRESYENSGRPMRRIYSCSSVDLNGSQLQLAGHPISEELSDSMTSQVTRLEMENEELRQDVQEARGRLADTQRNLDQVKGHLERQYQQKVSKLETETNDLRRRTSRELSREFKHKVTEIEEKSVKLKQRVSQEYIPRIGSLEKANQDLQKQLKSAQTNWEREQERLARLEAKNKEIVDEKEEFKQTIRTIQESSAARIEDLEKRLSCAQEKTKSLRRGSDRISYVSSEDLDKSNGQMTPPVTPSDKTHKRQGSDSSMHSYHGYPVQHNTRAHNGHMTPSQHAELLRKKPGRRTHEESPLPDRPHSALGVNNESASSGSTSSSHSFNPFKRKDKLRSTMSHQSKPIQMAAPFLRHDPRRTSMPERKAAYVAPERRHMAPPPSPGSASLDKKKGYVTSTGFSKHPSRPSSVMDMNRNVVYQDRGRGYSSDSGCATSPESPNSDLSSEPIRDENSHQLTSLQVISSEITRTQIKSSFNPRGDGKWKLLVDKIMELQDKNQALISENSELRRDINTVKFTAERLEHLEKKNMQLEVENSKLKQIIETMRYSLCGPGGLYDSREYQFSSNV